MVVVAKKLYVVRKEDEWLSKEIVKLEKSVRVCHGNYHSILIALNKRETEPDEALKEIGC